MDAITHGNRVGYLIYLFDFLAAWEKRPACLTRMAYEWCSAISEVAGGLEQGSMRIKQGPRGFTGFDLDMESALFDSGRNLVHSDNDSHASERPSGLNHKVCVDLLFMTLEIGFRLADASRDRPHLHLNHTSHHDQIFEAVFSCDDDGVIADAVGVWIVGEKTPAGLCARYFTKRVARAIPFSSRLRQAAIRALERNWRTELATSISDTVCLLNCLDVDVDDVQNRFQWIWLLVEIIRSLTGFESLSSHYWCLLGELTSKAIAHGRLGPRDEEVMKSLEGVENWEKLEAWMAVVWGFLVYDFMPELVEDIGRVTLKLTSQRPSALQKFGNLCKSGVIWESKARTTLQPILDRARAGQSPLESPPPP